jgi:predicted ribosomally synthesized peptide with nif11-like leader
MSIENVHAFRKRVDQNEELQGALQTSINAGNIREVVSLGGKNGFEFSEADLKTVFGAFLSSELSPAQLDVVVGGALAYSSPSISSFEQDLLLSAPPNIRQSCG